MLRSLLLISALFFCLIIFSAFSSNPCSQLGDANCDNLTIGGYNDWFLPSKDELNEMYINSSIIDSTANAHGGGSFTYAPGLPYWSSSEAPSIAPGFSENYAWYQFFGGVQTYSLKSNVFLVRAVRAF